MHGNTVLSCAQTTTAVMAGMQHAIFADHALLTIRTRLDPCCLKELAYVLREQSNSSRAAQQQSSSSSTLTQRSRSNPELNFKKQLTILQA
jgi:hypothetical protein